MSAIVPFDIKVLKYISPTSTRVNSRGRRYKRLSKRNRAKQAALAKKLKKIDAILYASVQAGMQVSS